MQNSHDNGESADSLSSRLCNDGNNAADWASFSNCIYQLANQKGFTINRLGTIAEYPVILLTPKQEVEGPRLLIAAGFHGDEPAGCWGVVRFLEGVSASALERVNLSIIPLLNVTGFVAGTRRNRWDEDPNRGYCHTMSGKPEPSHEGIILIHNLSLLKGLARDGFLSLHEDIEMEQFYIYTFEDSDTPGAFTEALRVAESKFFEPCPDEVVEGALLSRGIAFRFCDGSFEDAMFHEGVPRTACTETPGLLPIDLRIEANKHIIEAYIDFAQSM